MQILGVILIIAVIMLLVFYFKWSQQEVVAQKKGGEQRAFIRVEGGYNPNIVKVKKGQPVVLIFDRQEDSECSKKVLFSDFGISQELAPFEQTEIKFTPDKTGEFTFSCEMGMYQGKLIVE